MSTKKNPYENEFVNVMGYNFYVDKRVFVPDPETALFIEYCANNINPESTVIDVGTGCGVVGILLSKKNFQVQCVDISTDALDVARINISNICSPTDAISTLHSDLLSNPELAEPDYIVGILPWGSQDFILPSNQK